MGGEFPADFSELNTPQAMAAFIAQTLQGAMFGPGPHGWKGAGKGKGAPDQYVKPQEPPKFDGFRPPVDEWERKLLAWEQAYPNLRNRGALLVQALSGEPFKLVTTTLKPEVWSREALYDEYTGDVLVAKLVILAGTLASGAMPTASIVRISSVFSHASDRAPLPPAESHPLARHAMLATEARPEAARRREWR